MILGGTAASLAGAKPDPTPDWRCQVVFRDASGDKMKSDGLGTYRDGVGGVTCYVINEPGATQDRWLFMSITGTKRQPATRVVKYSGSNDVGQSYTNFDNNGRFEVMGLAKVGWNSTVQVPEMSCRFVPISDARRRRRRYRACRLWTVSRRWPATAI